MAINFERGGNPLNTLDIGDEKLVRDWLDLYDIPYDKDEFRYLKSRKDTILAIEVPIDREQMMKKYKGSERYNDDKKIPGFVKEGKIFITFQF